MLGRNYRIAMIAVSLCAASFALTSARSAGAAVLVADHADLSFAANNFGVSCWIKPSAVQSGWSDWAGVTKWGSGSTAEWGLDLRHNGGVDRPNFQVKVDGTTTYTAESLVGLSANEWHHLVGMRDGDEIRVFVDGVYRGSDSGLGSGALAETSNPIYIAEISLNNPAYRPDAIFDDVRIYSGALAYGDVALGETAGGEVAELHNLSDGDLIPEPATLAPLAVGGLGMLARRRRRAR